MAIDENVKPCTIVLHDDEVSKSAVLCGVNILSSGDLAYLSAPHAKTLCIYATSPTKNADEISVHVSVAFKFGFGSRMKGNVRLVQETETATATHIELSFRDQHLSRADMWRMEAQVDASVLYHGQKLKYLDSDTATVEAIYIAGHEVDSGFVLHPQTKLIFRSASSRFKILIQISKEMLECWRNGNLMYENLIQGFLPELSQRWKELKVRHYVSIVLFGRRLSTMPLVNSVNGHSVTNAAQSDGTEDFFDVVASDIPGGDFYEILRKLTEAIDGISIGKQFCRATKGNMLEALHIAATDFSDENHDPHLGSTGTSIIAITAGTGLFEAEYAMLRSTTNLLMGNSIGVDIVSLSAKPMHPVPIFQYEREGDCEYALPHWVDISYWSPCNFDHDSDWVLEDSTTELGDVSISMLEEKNFDGHAYSVVDAMESFDRGAFYSSVPTAESDDFIAVKSKSPTMHHETPKDSTSILHQPTPSILAPSATKDLEERKTPTPSLASVPSITRAKRENLPPHPLMQIGRKISVGPKGLALSQGVASTTVSAQHAQHERESLVGISSTTSETSSGLAKQIRDSLRRKPSQQSLALSTVQESSPSSKPIAIRTSEEKKVEEIEDPASLIEKAVMEQTSGLGTDTSLSATPKAQSGSFSSPRFRRLEELNGAIAPWLTLLNPCNPRRDNMRVASEYRKWQNVFPRPVSSGDFKWDSMCNPASLPLTTEVRVSLTDLEKNFNKKVRRLLATERHNTTSDPAHSIMLQMIAIRLSAGFQIVPMRRLPHAQMSSEQIDRMLLSIGNMYHELRCLSNIEVQVSEYERPPTTDEGCRSPEELVHTAKIKAILSRQERDLAIKFDNPKSLVDWSILDDLSINSNAANDRLGISRMRFVLVPVDLPRLDGNAASGTRGLSDEERRLDGIQRLTQMWQKFRYFTDDDQRHHASMVKLKPAPVERDPNPLAIDYQTPDPSAIVKSIGPNLNNQLANGEMSARLFSEAEMYHSSNFDITKLVKQMQEPPPNGVELRDRRWFTKLHPKCFRGDEMTNWLLRVFKDLRTREEAVSLGNQLMERDIFTHVRGKHEFRDGNYFYQIRSAHRTSDYPDTTGFFTKAIGRSVPSTPMTEYKHSPTVRATTGDSDSSSKGTPTPNLAPIDRNERREILLSQVMQYNVDSAKKSNQLELVNLHYDRIHSPENCYHFQLDWTSTTPKLIRESITRWTGLVENYGLKLVQVPLEEACKIYKSHPLDLPIRLSLARRPPHKVPATPQLEQHALLSPKAADDPNAHHKALLRKMDFVLDREAASSFPRTIEVKYSWGRPEYEHTQFIHKSGLILAQILNDGKHDFLLLPNRLHPRPPNGHTKKAGKPTPESIAEKFSSFCKDESALNAIYEEVNRPKVSPSPMANAALAADNDVPPIELPSHLTFRVQ